MHIAPTGAYFNYWVMDHNHDNRQWLLCSYYINTQECHQTGLSQKNVFNYSSEISQ